MKRSLRSWLWRVPVDQEIEEEIAFHVEMRTRDLIAAGLDPETARRTAVQRLGDVRSWRRTCIDIERKRAREMRVKQWLDELRGDVVFALRQLKGSPTFTLVAVLTLALGIGANSAMFALADATLFKPLPYPQPDRLVMVWERSAKAPRNAVAALNLRDWTEQNKTFTGLAAVALGLGGGPVLATPDGISESVERQAVTSGFFDVLGVTPIAGRTFQAADEGPRTSVVVISEGLWRARFGGDRGVIGRDVRLNGQPHTLIGVVPDSVRFSRPASIWTLLPQLSGAVTRRDARIFDVVGRLKPGVTIDEAQADLTLVADRLATQYPDTNSGIGITIGPLRAGLVGEELASTSAFLLGVVGVVLLMCCANVANLLLARARVRERELAVRSALGAGRARIVRQLLTESLILAGIGGVLGIGFGAAILEAAPAVIPAGLLPVVVALTFDGRVAAFCAIAALMVGMLFGLLPAWQSTRTSLVQAIASDSRSTTRGGGRFRHLIAIGQVATAVLLLCGAGLLLRTILLLGGFETGYRVDGDRVVTMDFSVPGGRYPTGDALLQFYDSVQRDVSALPGVGHVGWSSSLPWGSSELGRWPVEIVGDAPVENAARRRAEYSIASPGYFTALDIPIVAGRAFDARDARDTTPVCIVSEEFARRYLHGRDPIGARISIRPLMLTTVAAVREVIGVARQVKGQPDEAEELLQVYVPLAQVPFADLFLVVQPAAGRPQALVPPIRAAVARIDPNVPVRRSRTLDELAGEATARYRFRAVIASTFAGLALVLAMVGVFGVIAYSVQQRRREFGVRIALGATPGDVMALVVAGAARVIVIGGVLGLIAAAAVARSLSIFLFGVQPLDPVTFASVAVVVACTATIATAAPAWRAAQVDPVIAFRSE